MSMLIKSSVIHVEKVSMSCFNVPDALLDKTIAKEHFQKFGKVSRIKIRPKQKVCIVEFINATDAQRAFDDSGIYDGLRFRTSWTKLKNIDKKKESTIRPSVPNWTDNEDVRAELDAMKGTISDYKTFNSRTEADVSKKINSQTKKSTKLRNWKTEKSLKNKTKFDPTMSNAPLTDQELELFNVLLIPTHSSEEKYRVLDARDKLIRFRTKFLRDLANAGRTRGTCTDMCPEKERLQRETQHQIALYEQASGNKSRMNHTVAVKQYSRSSADQESPLAHELRPVQVLEMTMSYLLHRIMDLCEIPDVNLAEWYHFVWDRTRGIRKDITQQELCCTGSVTLVEQCARFHIHCSARLIAEDKSVFDEKINTENLTKCLQTLKYMYHDLTVSELSVSCKNEPEFRAYVILLNLNDANFMWEVQQLPSQIQLSPEIKFAIEVYSALDKNNYVKFFKLARQTTYLNACILLRYFNQVRYQALKIIIKSYSPRQSYTAFPIQELTIILGFEDEQNTIAFMEYYGLQFNAERSHVVLDRRNFEQPAIPFPLERAINIVESKRRISVGEVICGCQMPDKIFLHHVPFNSFDENGQLKLSEVSKEWQPKYEEYLSKQSSQMYEQIKPMQVQFDNDDIEVHDLEPSDAGKTSVKFTFSTPSLVTNNIAKTDVNSHVPNFTFTPPTNLFISDNKALSTHIFPTQIPVKNVEPRSTKENSNELIAKPFYMQISSASICKFKSKQNIFENISTTTDKIDKTSINSNASTVSNPKIKYSENNGETVLKVESKPNFSFVQASIKKRENNDIPTNFKPIQFPNKPDIPLVTSFPPKLQEIPTDPPEKARKLEEKIKLEQKEKEQREIIHKQIEEHRKLQRYKLENLIKEEQILRDKKIQSEVKILLEETCAIVQENIKNEGLSRIYKHIQRRNLLYCLHKWREVLRISKKKRKCFFDNSVWISTKNAETLGAEMYSEHQELTLHDRKRFKSGSPHKIKIVPRAGTEKLDICKIVWRILFEILCGKGSVLQLNIYWKIALSLPKNEEYKQYNSLQQQICSTFNLNGQNNNLSTVQQYAMNNGGSFAYSIKLISNKEDNLSGLLFFVHVIHNSTYRRLAKIINKRQPIPLIVVFTTNENNFKDFQTLQSKLNDLCDQAAISNYKFEFLTHNDFTPVITASLKWLARNVQKPLELEMDAMSTFLRNGICEDFWYRIQSTADTNYSFRMILNDPKFVIDLHNEAVHLLSQIVLNPELLKQQNFPSEFKQFQSRHSDYLPCTFEYFPDNWQSKSYWHAVKTTMDAFKLPNFTYSWPAKDMFEFQTILQDYCGKIFNREDTMLVLKVVSEILIVTNFLATNSFEDYIRYLFWPHIIQTIMLEKLKFTMLAKNSMKYMTVVYSKMDKKKYFETPWWYNLATVTEKMTQMDFEFSYPSETPERNLAIETDVDKMITELESRYLDDSEAEADTKNKVQQMLSILDDIQESMAIDKKFQYLFGETLKRT